VSHSEPAGLQRLPLAVELEPGVAGGSVGAGGQLDDEGLTRPRRTRRESPSVSDAGAAGAYVVGPLALAGQAGDDDVVVLGRLHAAVLVAAAWRRKCIYQLSVWKPVLPAAGVVIWWLLPPSHVNVPSLLITRYLYWMTVLAGTLATPNQFG